jgi:uncharacterized repeat protein (TIGR01451 family)
VVTWTPTSGQVGSQSLVIHVQDRAGVGINQTTTINVVAGPVITGVSTTAALGSSFKAGATIEIDVTFTSAVDVTGTPTLKLNNGATATYASGTGSATLAFVYAVAAGDDTAQLDYDSTGALSLAGGSIVEDASGVNANVAATLTLPATGTDGLAAKNIDIDTVAPTATVTTKSTNSHTPTITITVNDAAPSSGIATVTVHVNGHDYQAVQTNGPTWTAAVTDSVSDGTYDVGVAVTDKAGNSFSNTQTSALTIDSVAPTVTGVSTDALANSTLNLNDSLTISVTFSESVVVTGTPRLLLNDSAIVDFSGGSGTATLSFHYTVGAGQNTNDLDYSSIAALILNGGTINDAAGNAATLTLPTPGTTADALGPKQITVISPVIGADLSVTITPSAATAIVGGSIGYTIVVTNNGPAAATNFKLIDVLPTSLIFGVQVEQSGGPSFTLSNNGNTVTNTISSLDNGASATFSIIADVAQNVANGTVISNTATVSSDTPDNTNTNDSATATTTAKLTGIMLSPDSLDSTKMQLTVGGTAGVDSITFLPAAGGKISVNMNGHMNGPFAVDGRLVALGQAGNDAITVNSAIKLPAYLYGGAGNNQLVGGSGDNVLVGGAGTNTLIGGTAHNLLIAGTGPARLFSTRQGMRVGPASGSILVGGTTDFDQNDVALATIMQEWGSTDAYATRISKIKGGTLAGGVALTSTTVHQPSTHVVDQLYASTGFDWFLAPSVFDQIFGVDPHKTPKIQVN